MTEELAAEQPARIAVQTASRPIREGWAPPSLLFNRNCFQFLCRDVDNRITAGGMLLHRDGEAP